MVIFIGIPYRPSPTVCQFPVLSSALCPQDIDGGDLTPFPGRGWLEIREIPVIFHDKWHGPLIFLRYVGVATTE